MRKKGFKRRLQGCSRKTRAAVTFWPPAPWRRYLRLLGFLAAAVTIACILTGLGVSRRNQPSFDASTVAITVGITSILASSTLGSSLLFPSRMGVPSRIVALSLWIATAGSLGSVAALTTRPETWDASTPVWWALTAAAGIGMLVLAMVVTFARRPRARGPAPVTEEHVSELRLSLLTGALEHSTEAVLRAWQRLAPETRHALERERDDAIAMLEERDAERVDAEWLRSAPPGLLGLPAVADETYRIMSLGDAQSAAQKEPGRYGHFVKRSRRQSSQPE